MNETEGTLPLEEEESIKDSFEDCESTFSLLEIDYKNITTNLEDNEELAEFATAYTRLYNSFHEIHENNEELTQQILEQKAQIEDLKDVIVRYGRREVECQELIEKLQNKLEYTKRLADDAHTREQITQEIIENMRNQIIKLNNELELKARLAGEEEEKMGELSKTQEGFEREKQRIIDEITSLKQKLTNALSYSEELEHKNSAADLKANEMTNLLEQHISEGTKKQRQIDKLQGDVNTCNTEIEALTQNIDEYKEIIDTRNNHITFLETQLKVQKNETDKAAKNGEMTQIKLDKCQMEQDMLTLEFNDLKEKHTDLSKAFKRKSDESNTLRSDVIKLTKQKDNLEKKLMLTERQKFNVEYDRDQMRTKAQVMEREVFLSKRQSDSDKKTIEALQKEKEILSKNLIRVQGTIEGHMKLIKIQEQSKFKLETEIKLLNEDVVHEKKISFKYETERNRAISESLDLTQQVEDAMDDNNLKQKHIFELKKMISELETKLRQQQNLFEMVRSERNNLQKEVQEATSEVFETKAKLKICTHQGQQLKEDITTKDFQVAKQENVIKKLSRDKENLKVEIQNCLNRIKVLNHEILELKENEKSFVACIAEREKVIKKGVEAYDQMLNDRDIIGAQLVRRNDERELLTQKINIFAITLARGETQYNQRVDDIKLLKCEIRRLRQEKNYLSKSISNMTDLKTEVFTLERELARERLKCAALEEELQHPMNIHRWRKLEGSDPRYVDLVKKIKIIQKRHLNLISESIERENQLKESEKLYINLRQMLARQPGPELKNELLKTKKALVVRGTKMKCLVSEISMYATQVNDYKTDIEKLSKELLDTKQKYFKQKKIYQSQQPIKLPAIKTADAR